MSERFTLRRQIEFNHCDPAGMVFYPRYFEMISATIERFLADEIDYGWTTMGANTGGFGTPMGQIDVRFRNPSYLGEWLDFSLGLTRLGRSSATFEIICTGDGQTRFVCNATIVHADTGGGKAQPWPDAARAAMTRFLDTSEEPKTRTTA